MLQAALLEALRVAAFGLGLGVLVWQIGGAPMRSSYHDESASCAPPVAAAPAVGWIEGPDAAGLVSATEVTFADARSIDEFERGHIAGAVSIPMDTGAIAPELLALVRGAGTVVTYCDAGSDCAASRRLAELLAAAGVRDVRVLRGGFAEWLAAERPTESGPCTVCP